jgi:hypothetical protein
MQAYDVRLINSKHLNLMFIGIFYSLKQILNAYIEGSLSSISFWFCLNLNLKIRFKEVNHCYGLRKMSLCNV